jgi:hypothetical protein
MPSSSGKTFPKARTRAQSRQPPVRLISAQTSSSWYAVVHSEHPEAVGASPVQRVQAQHQQDGQGADEQRGKAAVALHVVLCEPGVLRGGVPCGQQAGLPPPRALLDCTRRTPALRRTRVVKNVPCRHGFGNWTDIADFIGSDKTREDVEGHYQAIFLDHPNFIPVLSSRPSKAISSARGPKTALSSDPLWTECSGWIQNRCSDPNHRLLPLKVPLAPLSTSSHTTSAEQQAEHDSGGGGGFYAAAGGFRDRV